MSISKRGARPITVDGVRYLWRIRLQATYWQDMFSSPLLIAVQSAAEGARGVLVIDTAMKRPDSCFGGHGGGISPAQVRDMILRGLAEGWEPQSGRMTLRYALHPDHIGPWALGPREVLVVSSASSGAPRRRSRRVATRRPASART